MQAVAFLTSSNMVPGSPDARADLFEFELQFPPMAAACRTRLISLTPVVWDAPDTDWARYDAAVIGTTWDYWDKQDAYLPGLAGIEATGARLFNSTRTVAWNMDKSYLRALGEAGVPTIPTLWPDDLTPDVVSNAFDALDTDELVIKPRIGAGGHGLVRVRRGDPFGELAPGPTGPRMIQPFLPDIVKGEVTVMTYDGIWSHGVRKLPAEGDYRVQSLYGGREVMHEPTRAELDVVYVALAAIRDALGGERLLYARIDLAPGHDGRPALIEAELIEPYHYAEQGPWFGAYFATALDRLLNGG